SRLRLLATLLASCCSGALDDSQNLVFTHDQELFAIQLDFGSAVFPEQDTVARLNVQGLTRTVFFVFSVAGCHYFTFLGFFLGGVGDNYAAADLFSLFNASHDNAIVKRSNVCSHFSLNLLSKLHLEVYELNS